MNNKLAILVPCYDEEYILEETTQQLTSLLDDLKSQDLVSDDSFILFVNDGSKDNTWPMICKYHQENKYVKGLNLAANVGHQYALWAGSTFVADHADIIITIDADLQDDINVMHEMIEKYHEGRDIVYGVRNDRLTDSWFKRNTAYAFYHTMKALGVKIVHNHADYRLMSQRALKHLLQYKERNLFIRGLVPLIGYSTDSVYYKRTARHAGKSKYSLFRMLGLAIDGITSFSIKPIRLVFALGIIFVLVALAMVFWTLYSHFQGLTVPGWSSLMLSIWFCSGCVLIGMGVIGEYIGKIYIETKERPLYNIQDVLF